ncbi:hypothetical protein Bpfe_025791 [Biomphalaria pfeifferi]|uniref:Uncharacterized protein n=1 Tax=Biomphalaria pfeifferi TaxID=112525 RepID=A0AAD8AYH7_BIOPF|nr:hypothetical protein Bpfe_025791 [Biomphalaria pfeifferi]
MGGTLSCASRRHGRVLDYTVTIEPSEEYDRSSLACTEYIQEVPLPDTVPVETFQQPPGIVEDVTLGKTREICLRRDSKTRSKSLDVVSKDLSCFLFALEDLVKSHPQYFVVNVCLYFFFSSEQMTSWLNIII